MQRMQCGAVAAALLYCSAAHAQHPIQWKQTINVPKGLNLPKDAKVDILGIELGDSFDEVKPKLEGLLAEVNSAAKAAPVKQPPSGPLSQGQIAAQRLSAMEEGERAFTGNGNAPQKPLTESTVNMYMRINDNNRIEVSYVNGLVLERELPGKGAQKYRESVGVQFSAPSSGRQAIGITRSLNYPNQQDQPRISELMARLKEKLKVEPQVLFSFPNTITYRFQYNDGRGYVPATPNILTCKANFAANSAAAAEVANQPSDCDVILEWQIFYGLSKDHASSMVFTLSDNERTKQAVGADFAFFRNYVRDLQSRTGGAAPKL